MGRIPESSKRPRLATSQHGSPNTRPALAALEPGYPLATAHSTGQCNRWPQPANSSVTTSSQVCADNGCLNRWRGSHHRWNITYELRVPGCVFRVPRLKYARSHDGGRGRTTKKRMSYSSSGPSQGKTCFWRVCGVRRCRSVLLHHQDQAREHRRLAPPGSGEHGGAVRHPRRPRGPLQRANSGKNVSPCDHVAGEGACTIDGVPEYAEYVLGRPRLNGATAPRAIRDDPG